MIRGCRGELTSTRVTRRAPTGSYPQGPSGAVDDPGTLPSMRGARASLAGVILTALVVALAACSTSSLPRVMDEEGIYGPPTMGDWLEIDGRWVVATSDGEGHALLQPASDVDPDDDGPRDADVARWVDVATGETIWERDDISAVLYQGDEQMVAAIGSGSSRAFASIDLLTGETLWSVPESEVGECSPWQVATYWGQPSAEADQPADEASASAAAEDSPTSVSPSSSAEADGEAATPPRLVLSGPEHGCQNAERALLVELDVTTGEVIEILRGHGSMEVGWIDGGLALAVWRDDGVILHFYDNVGEQVSTVDLSASDLVAGTDRTTLPSSLEMLFHEVLDGRPFLRVVHVEDDGRYLLNDFLLDPAAGTADRQQIKDCAPDQDDVGYNYQFNDYVYDTTSLTWCITRIYGADQWEVRTWRGEDATSWMAPFAEDADVPWQVTSCRGEVSDLTDARTLLLGTAPDARLRAYDILTGEVIWSLDEGVAGPVVVDTWRDPDRVIVLSEDSEGTQLLRTLRLCTGEVLDEREVSGADVENGSITSSGWVVAIPLGETTMLAQFHERGEKPHVPVRAEADAGDA